MDFDSLEDEVPPPVTTDIPFTSTAPPPAAPSTGTTDSRIANAIAALFAHINVIHSDLIERIGLVHEQVDLIVERQAHDIVAIRDTLSVLSRRHTEFIMEVNDFINSIRRW